MQKEAIRQNLEFSLSKVMFGVSWIRFVIFLIWFHCNKFLYGVAIFLHFAVIRIKKHYGHFSSVSYSSMIYMIEIDFFANC